MPPTYHHHLGDVFADLKGHDPPDYLHVGGNHIRVPTPTTQHIDTVHGGFIKAP